jgi:hypothetical protein
VFWTEVGVELVIGLGSPDGAEKGWKNRPPHHQVRLLDRIVKRQVDRLYSILSHACRALEDHGLRRCHGHVGHWPSAVGEKWHGFPALLAAALVTFAYTVGVPTGEDGGVQASNCKLVVSAFFAEQ